MRFLLRSIPRAWLLLVPLSLALAGTIAALVHGPEEVESEFAPMLESLRAGRFREALVRLGRPPAAIASWRPSPADLRVWQEAWSLLVEGIGPKQDDDELQAAVDLALRALVSGADLIEPPHVIAARLRHMFLVRGGASAPFKRLGELFVAPVFDRDPEMTWEGVAAAALAERWPEAASLYLAAVKGGDPPSERAELRCWPDPRFAREALWGIRIAEAIRRAAPDIPEEIGRGIEEARARILGRIAEFATGEDPEHRSFGFFLAGARSLIEGDSEGALPLLARALREAASFYEGGEDPDYLPVDRAGMEICLVTAEALARAAEPLCRSGERRDLPPSIRRARLVELAILSARAKLREGVEGAAAALGRMGGSEAAAELVLLLRRVIDGDEGVEPRIRERAAEIPGLAAELAADPLLAHENLHPFEEEELLRAAIRIGRLCEELGLPEIAGPAIARIEGIPGVPQEDVEAIRLYIEGLSLAARGDAEAAAAMHRKLLDLRLLRGEFRRGLDVRDVADRLASLASRREREKMGLALRQRARRSLEGIVRNGSGRDGAEGLVAVAQANLFFLLGEEGGDAEEAAAAFASLRTPTEREDRAWLELARRLRSTIVECEGRGSPARGEVALRALRTLCGDREGSRFLLEEGRIHRARALRAEPGGPEAKALWSRAARAFELHARSPSNGRFAFEAGEAHFLAEEFEAAAASFGDYLDGETVRQRDDTNRTDAADHRLFTSQILLALSLLRSGSPGGAIDALEALEAESRGILARAALYVKGMAELELGFPEAAERTFRRLVAEEEGEDSPRWRRAQLRLSAIALARAEALDRDPSAASAARQEAYRAARIPALRVIQVLGAAEDPPLSIVAGAAGLFEDADWRTPTGIACALYLGEAAEGLARADGAERSKWLAEAERWFGEAAARFERAERAETSPDLQPPGWVIARAFLGAADAAFDRGEMERAREAYERARLRELGSAQELWTLYRLGTCARSLGQSATARRYLEAGARLLASGTIRGAELDLLPGPDAPGDRARFWREKIDASLSEIR